MTWARYRLPIEVCRQWPPVHSGYILPDSVSVVVPVKDDQYGLHRTLRSLARLSPLPREVRVVDDGSEEPVDPRVVRSLLPRSVRVGVVRHRQNRGAAASRNTGLQGLSGWVYFTDCGCTHPPDLLALFAAARRSAFGETVAVAGPVDGEGSGRIPRYMTEQGNLNPPMDANGPQALVTANAMVWAPAAHAVGGFDERFPSAGGEDLDLGLALLRKGSIAWAPDAVAAHEFPDDLADFDRRFHRYGRGLRLLARKLDVDLAPFHFGAYSYDLQDLADRQTFAMGIGYGAVCEARTCR
jgi:glycosyltransferase involved in cell wall biosynthesis